MEVLWNDLVVFGFIGFWEERGGYEVLCRVYDGFFDVIYGVCGEKSK